MMFVAKTGFAAVAALLLLLIHVPPVLGYPRAAYPRSDLPTVDLGYEVHQAIDYNETTQLYNFSNIRFALPPVGELRWAAPQPPDGINSTVTTGPNIEPICPQAAPWWYPIADELLEAIVAGTEDSLNYTAAVLEESDLIAETALEYSNATADPRQREDCLFLDVIVPASVFEAPRARDSWGSWDGGPDGGPPGESPGGAPVLIWIYGGGYTGGWKTSYGDPSGLIAASDNSIIYVAINYRLGALGFMGGNKLKESGGVPNAALYDQRLAIEWVAKYIHLFGGDKNQITIMGESAGGGSIVHQITAFGGQSPVSFQRAIPQSPAWQVIPSPTYEDDVAEAYLSLLGVDSFAEARTLDYAAVLAAQATQIASAPYGLYYYGPVVDGPGGFAPKTPAQLLDEGSFAHEVGILVGHNADEAPFFTSPEFIFTSDLTQLFENLAPFLPNATAEYVATDVYPPVFDGSAAYPWTSNLTRAETIISDAAFTCNTHYLNRAYGNRTWAYEFEVYPPFHGFDASYTFWDRVSAASGFSTAVATTLQGYITSFVRTGDPNAAGLAYFPQQGTNASLNALNSSYIGPAHDSTVNQRCVFWQHVYDV